MPLDELLAAEGLEGRIDEVVAWARARADEILAADALDDELAGVLDGTGNGVYARGAGVPELQTEAGHTQPGVPLPPRPVEEPPRAPLPPVPQRPDHDSTRADDELEMLDEDDLELVEDLAEEGSGDDEAGGESSGGADDERGAGERESLGDREAGGNGSAESHETGDGEPTGEDGSAEPVPPLGVSDSSPEWKRALEDAQSD